MNKLTARMFEINTRKAEIRSAIENNNEEIDLNALETELNTLNTEFSDIEKRMKLTDSITIEKPNEKEINNMENTYTIDSKEYRSAWLKTLQGTKLNEVEQRAFTSATDSGAAAIIKLIKDNEACMDCPLAKSIVNQLPLQLKQDLYKN